MTERNTVLKRLVRKLWSWGESEADVDDLIQVARARSLEYSREEEKEDTLGLERQSPLMSPVRNPHEILADGQRLRDVRAALNELLDGTGDIFVFHRAGYTYKELAVEFKLPESAIEKRIARAMLWLMDQKEQ
jgi:DNA-directed RNA polymerase specialized sigma24 family protein